MSAGSNAPTIIKRKKVIAGGGHHGGAWKVAMFHGPFKGALHRVGSGIRVLCRGLKRRSDGVHRVQTKPTSRFGDRVR